jgi:hypothetical protein
MARGGKRVQRPLPPPLPPETRTVGQLVGEAIKLYGADFWRALALGVPVVIVNALAWTEGLGAGRVALVPLSAALLSVSYVGASVIVTGAPLRSRATAVAYGIAVLVFLPFPVLVSAFVLPGLAWLALFGLAVPATIAERLGLRSGFARGYHLARADFVHVLGGLATLALIVIISQFSLYFVLREFAENTRIAAAALAALVVSPLVFLGSAILYVDQKARLDRPARGRATS